MLQRRRPQDGIQDQSTRDRVTEAVQGDRLPPTQADQRAPEQMERAVNVGGMNELNQWLIVIGGCGVRSSPLIQQAITQRLVRFGAQFE